MRRYWVLTLLLAIGSLTAYAQDDNWQNWQKEFDDFNIQAWKEYEEFRKQALKEYQDMVRRAWAEFKGEPAEQVPEEETILPVFADKNENETASIWDSLKRLFKKKGKKMPRQAQPKPIKGNGEVLAVGKEIAPLPKFEQPEPVLEIQETPQQVQHPNDYMAIDLFGLECKIRIGENCGIHLNGLTPDDVANAMSVFEKPQFNDMLYDCLEARKHYHLSDWAYYLMLQKLVDSFYGKDTNEASLALSFLFSQSGYKTRMVRDKQSLMVLVASHHYIFGKDYTFEDINSDVRLYLLDGRRLGAIVKVCPARWKNEGSMSLQLTAEQVFKFNKTPRRTIRSRKNPDFVFTITSNKNYIDFFNTYPASYFGKDNMSRWAIYAETPLEKGIRDQLYPAMREKVKGMSEVEAVRQLLWWTQGDDIDNEMTKINSEYFQYALDDLVWGTDRAFFGEETLFYSWCDCEDRAILFSHLVREVVGLDVALVYYPGHLATAVAFNEPVRGDGYVARDGRHYTVCDPTFLGANIGETMTTVIGKPATLIPLKKN